MNGKVGFGVIGVGVMGSNHVESLGVLPNTELVAVCDRDPAAFDRIDGKVRSGIRCCTDPEEFFRTPGLEAVLVAVPHYFHPDLAIAAMEHGKHIIVEKPIAVHKAEARRLIDAAAKHPELVKSAMFNQRTLPAHRKLKHLIDSGELGRIFRVNWIITDWFRSQMYYDSGDWRATWGGEGGGVLLNQCPHQLDLFQWFFGMPQLVSARVRIGKYHDIEVEDEVNAYLEYADGKTGNFITSTGEAPGTNRLEVMADRGRVILENGRISFLRNEIGTTEFTRTSLGSYQKPPMWECEIGLPPALRSSGHQLVIENVANAILKGEKLIAPLEEGINGLELGNAMLMSGLLKKDITLPLDAAAYAEMLAGLVKNSTRKVKTVRTADASGFGNSF
ncbi:MAG: Gfo/Idh/MocA family oxidoreductase [Lentisphaeria bacterium]|nr:Gfo/Idh/MocA family oxidoreductase [Lentisphaeria bacterium]